MSQGNGQRDPRRPALGDQVRAYLQRSVQQATAQRAALREQLYAQYEAEADAIAEACMDQLHAQLVALQERLVAQYRVTSETLIATVQAKTARVGAVVEALGAEGADVPALLEELRRLVDEDAR